MQKLTDLAAWSGSTKSMIELDIGLEADATHVHVGMLIFLGSALILRKRLNHWLPWAITLVIELSNEFIDLFQPSGLEASIPAGWHDIKNTMFLPTLIVLLVTLRERVPFLKPKGKRR